jgi:hypothetical protein
MGIPNLFEESAAARGLEAKDVRDLSAYLYRTFLWKVSLVRGKQARLDTSLRDKARPQFLAHQTYQAEISLLFDEVIATYDKATQQKISA